MFVFLGKLDGNPSSGFSDKTLEEEDIAFIQLAGIYPLNKYYTVYCFVSFCVSFFMIGGMVVASYLDSQLNVTFENAHILLICINMCVQSFTHRYHQGILKKLFRAIDNQFFSYGDCMDGNTTMIINELEREKNARKKIYGKAFKIQASCAAFGLAVKRLLLYLYNGRGLKDVDGENWLMYQAPVASFFPFSHYWVPYMIGLVFNYNSILTINIAAIASTTSFIRFSEEILHQLRIVKLSLRNVMARASHLYTLRYGCSYLLEIGRTDKDFDQCLITCLTKSVQHHAIIIELFGDFKKLLFIPLFTVIFDGSALICMSTVQLLMSDSPVMKISMALFIATELCYTFIYCSYGDQLTRLFSEIGDQIYLDDWLAHSKIIKPYIMVIKAYTFYPKKLSAGGFTSPNLLSFGNVLRSTYSLLNFLVTIR